MCTKTRAIDALTNTVHENRDILYNFFISTISRKS